VRMSAYFGVSAGFTIGRVLPQAVLTPILLEKGLQFDTIIWTQLIYMVVLTVTQFPAGLLADRYSRKRLYVLSILVVGVAYSIIWCGDGLAAMCSAWAVYAVGMALNGSTMDIHFATLLREDDQAFRRFFVVDRNVVLCATIASASATTVLYPLVASDVYVLSVALFVGSAVWGAFCLPETAVVRRSRMEPPPRLLASLREDRYIVSAVLLVALTQLAFTPFFQMWQMVFLDSGLTAAWFGLIFVLFQCVNIAANAAWRRLPHRTWMSPALLCLIALIGCGIVAFDSLIRVLLVVILPFPLFLYSNSLVFSLQTRAPAALLSSMNALMGTGNTIGAFLMLGLSLLGLQVFTPGMLLGISLIVCAVASVALLTGSMVARNLRRRALRSTEPDHTR